MKNKKVIGIITAIGVCALLVFSVVVFPFILAASPENRELETIETNNAYPAEEIENPDYTEQPTEPGQQDNETTTIDINAITEEMAIAIALEDIPVGDETVKSLAGATHTTSLELRGAKYIESIDHIDAPVWRVLFYAHDYGESLVYIEHQGGDDDLEHEFTYRIGDFCCFSSSMGEDNSGLPAIITSYSYAVLYFIDINAFTGELVGQGQTAMCDHEGTKRELSYDLNTDWVMLQENMYYWTLTPEKVPRELNYNKQSFGTTWDRLIRVPDMVGRTQTEVVAAFSGVDLALDIHLVDSNEPAGTVIFIYDAGEIVPKGTTIHIRVSTGSSSPHPTPEPSPRPIG